MGASIRYFSMLYRRDMESFLLKISIKPLTYLSGSPQFEISIHVTVTVYGAYMFTV